MTIRSVVLLTFIVGIGATAAQAAPSQSCMPPVEVANVPIVQVEPNGMLVTNDGRAVKLEGLLLPGGARDHAPQFLVGQSLTELSDLTHGHLVNLLAKPPKEDRYGRVRSQVIVSDNAAEPWVQITMLRLGLARVSISPDRTECAKELYAAESEAREKHSGLWSQASYAALSAANVPLSNLGTFQIVEGMVANAAVHSGRAYINFGVDWKSDFTVTISPEDMKNFRDMNIDPATYYTGKTLRVRGVVEQLNGPEIEVAAPAQIEEISELRPAVVQ
ncbi:MAG TPA: thermonuclease family protein [Rhizomicrobium sp.]